MPAATRSPRTLAVQVTVPLPAGAPESPEGVREELERLWLIDQVRQHRMGIGKAAELAGVPRGHFMQLLGAHGVPVIDYPVEDFERELRRLGLP